MRHPAVIVAAVVLLAYLALCALMYGLQRSLLYMPQARGFGGPDRQATLKVADATLDLSVRPRPAGAPALLYFGGNAEDVSASLADFERAFPGHAIYLMHYRGYGRSSGSPSEAALHADALALFDEAHATHETIVVIGRSLGSGLAVRLAAERPVARLVLVTPYDSIQAVAQRHYPYLPVGLLLRDKFESWRFAPAVHAPTLILAAEHDEVIPRIHTERLQQRFPPGIVVTRVIRGTDHNSISEAPEYLSLIAGR